MLDSQPSLRRKRPYRRGVPRSVVILRLAGFSLREIAGALDIAQGTAAAYARKHGWYHRSRSSDWQRLYFVDHRELEELNLTPETVAAIGGTPRYKHYNDLAASAELRP